MNGRERILTALDGGTPDRVPCALNFYHVDLDGYNADDTTLDSLVAGINVELSGNFPGIQASTSLDNELSINSSSGELTFSFADDTSGVLSALGINTFFSGQDAGDIAVSSVIVDDPGLIAAALTNMAGDNANVTEMISFQFNPLESLGGMSIEEYYQSLVSTLGVESAAAQDRYEGATAVKSALVSQREAVSGVSLDEEAVKLIQYQSGYQAAARFITVVDELLQVLLAM